MKLIKNAQNKLETECPFCGRHGVHAWHHCFGSSDKKHSETYGAIIYPCTFCHTWDSKSIHKDPNQVKNKYLKEHFQQLIMEDQNWTAEEFAKVFRKSYL